MLTIERDAAISLLIALNFKSVSDKQTDAQLTAKLRDAKEGVDELDLSPLDEADAKLFDAIRNADDLIVGEAKPAANGKPRKVPKGEKSGTAPKGKPAREVKAPAAKAAPEPKEKAEKAGTDAFGFRIGSNRAKAAKLLSDKPITLSALIEKAKIPPVSRMMWEMTKAGLLKNDGEGYFLTKAGLAKKAGKAAK